jgi:hypothetical protein
MVNNLDFVIIGAAKAGTTSLYKKLSMHPDIFMSTPKEPEFFAREEIYARGGECYMTLFSSANAGQICGEASTLYSLIQCFPESAKRMYNHAPEAKIIFVLRNPVERAYSYYIQILKNYQNSTGDFSVNRTFEECLFPEQYPNRKGRDKFFASFDHHHKDVPETFTGGGQYMKIINEYLKYYSRRNLLLIKFEDLVDDIDAVSGDVCEFLKLDKSKLIGSNIARENISSEHFSKVDKELNKQSIVSKLKKFPAIEPLSKLIPKRMRKYLLDWYSNISVEKKSVKRPPKMKDSTRVYLKSFYLAETNELEKFLGQNLETWK